MRAMAKAGRLRDGKKGERIVPFAFFFGGWRFSATQNSG
jgi:hypothetical protein